MLSVASGQERELTAPETALAELAR